MIRAALISAFAVILAACASGPDLPAPSVSVHATPAHVRDVLVAIMTTASVKTGKDLRVVKATPYTVVFDGPQGSGSWLTPSGYAEIDFTMAPEGANTLVVGRTYNVAPQGNIATGTEMRVETTSHTRKKFLLPMLNALKRCAVKNASESCPTE